ncbi:MAG TPA: DUF397 domain-containing protein [Acidimicrobiales bacterium]|nr:DUF397 domain-containing protein [Acidimicrobiales bacterium]
MWRRSSRCGADHVTEQCVEVASCPGHCATGVVLRNSRFPNGDQVHADHDEWQAFVAGVKAGEFDDLA